MHIQKNPIIKKQYTFWLYTREAIFLLASSFSQGPRRSFLHFLGYLTPDIWPIREN